MRMFLQAFEETCIYMIEFSYTFFLFLSGIVLTVLSLELIKHVMWTKPKGQKTIAKCSICGLSCQLYRDSLRSPGKISTEIYTLFHRIKNWNHIAFFVIYPLINLYDDHSKVFTLLKSFVKRYNKLIKYDKYKIIVTHFSTVLLTKLENKNLSISFKEKTNISSFVNQNMIFKWFLSSVLSKKMDNFETIRIRLEKDASFFPSMEKNMLFIQLLHGFDYSKQHNNVIPMYSISNAKWFRSGIELSLFSKPSKNFIQLFDGIKTRIVYGKKHVNVIERKRAGGIFNRYPLLDM